MKTLDLVSFLVLALLPVAATGQAPAAPGFQDDLLDHLQGQWIATGISSGKPTTFKMQSEWMLDHQFFHISQTQQSAVGARAFQADFYIGYDPGAKHYVAHVLTIFGAEDAPNGSGKRDGNDLTLLFQRPKGDILYHFDWQPESSTWHIVALNQGSVFIDLTAKREASLEPAK